MLVFLNWFVYHAGGCCTSALLFTFSCPDGIVQCVNCCSELTVDSCEEADSLCVESWLTWYTLLQYRLAVNTFRSYHASLINNNCYEDPSYELSRVKIGSAVSAVGLLMESKK